MTSGVRQVAHNRLPRSKCGHRTARRRGGRPLPFSSLPPDSSRTVPHGHPDLAAAQGQAAAAGRTVRIGSGEVTTVRTMTQKIADILDEIGGGHARPRAAAFFVNTVAPYLQAAATEHIRKDP